MRSAVAFATLLLAGCGNAAERSATSDGPADDRVDCRPAGEARFARICMLDAADSPDGRVLTLRKPDGGFRRLLVTPDGRGVVAADGAEPARVAILDGGRIEVEIGGDRFRLPATVRRP